MSKIHFEKAPPHKQSLLETEIESRSNLVTPKTGLVRQKKKEIEDPRLGADMTQKILRSAINQIAEDDSVNHDDTEKLKESLVVSIDEDEENPDEEIELELETNDEESRALFEMFKNTIAHEASHSLDHTLTQTRHQVDPKIQEMYKKLSQFLKIYKSGKLPKAVNVLASQNIPDWLDLMYLSKPEEWSKNALEAVTTLFSQTASDERLEVYIREILFAYVENILESSKKLPKQVWNALLAAARRPPCFIKGLLLPLSTEVSISLKEARVISALVTKIKLPKDHMNALLIRICEDVPSPVRTIFVARLVSKRQALAIQAIDAVVAYFYNFLNIDEKQPLLWHKALLEFVKSYCIDLQNEQREAIVQIMQKHRHEQIDKEIISLFEKIPPREEVPEPESIPLYGHPQLPPAEE